MFKVLNLQDTDYPIGAVVTCSLVKEDGESEKYPTMWYVPNDPIGWIAKKKCTKISFKLYYKKVK